MAYEGYVDFSNGEEIRGWIFEDGDRDRAFNLEILAGAEVIASVMADQFRQDLLNGQKGNGRHGFSYKAKSPYAFPLAARVVGKRWKIPAGGPPNESWKVMGVIEHSLNFGRPQVPYGMSDAGASPVEAEIVERLVNAFHHAKADDPMRKSRKDDIWSSLANTIHQEIVNLLDHKDIPGVARYLREAHAKDITHGITQGEITTNTLRARPDACEFAILQFTDSLVSLAEFLGVLDVESPEQVGRWAENLHSDPEQLIAGIEKAIGIPLVPPQVIGSLLGINTAAGMLSGRDLNALYAALRLKEIGSDLNVRSPRVCEIGGGLGGVAYYANRLGISNYTIIDLPLINVLQGYYLLRALPGVGIHLYGESPREADQIHLLPTWVFNAPDLQYDLMLNQDSFPELHSDYSKAYLKQALTNVTTAFYSINQEARAPQSPVARQTVVRDLIKEVGGYERGSRFRHWLHPGYVEEVYRIRK